MTQLEFEDEVASDLQRATGLVQTSSAESPSLSRMLQLSGDNTLRAGHIYSPHAGVLACQRLCDIQALLLRPPSPAF